MWEGDIIYVGCGLPRTKAHFLCQWDRTGGKWSHCAPPRPAVPPGGGLSFRLRSGGKMGFRRFPTGSYRRGPGGAILPHRPGALFSARPLGGDGRGGRSGMDGSVVE